MVLSPKMILTLSQKESANASPWLLRFQRLDSGYPTETLVLREPAPGGEVQLSFQEDSGDGSSLGSMTAMFCSGAAKW